MKHLILFFAATFWLLYAVCAYGQTADSLRKVHNLPQTEVFAGKYASVLSSASPLRVLGDAEMLRLGVSDIGGAMRCMPGITLRDYGGAGGMKTLSVRGLGTQHTGVSYNGITLTECQTGAIDLSRYSLENVANLTLYIGDNDDIFIPARHSAYAAILHINALPPSLETRRPSFMAQSRVGSFGYVSQFLRYSQMFSPRLAVTFAADYVYADNDYPFTLRNANTTVKEKRTNSRMNSVHAEAAVRWEPTRKSSLQTQFYYYDNRRQLPGVARYYTAVAGENLHDRNFFVQTCLHVHSQGAFSLKWNAKINWAKSAYCDTTFRDRLRDATYWQREAYTSLCLLYSPSTRWSAACAADYVFNNLSSTLSSCVRPLRHTLLQSATLRYSSPHVVATARLLHSLCINSARLGASSKNVRRLSPSASLSWQPVRGRQFYVRLAFKEIFRAPTFNENYFFHYGSSELKPETTRQINGGITYGGTSRGWLWKFTADAYMNRVADKIVAVPYNMFIWRTVNMGKVRGSGAELSVEVARTLSPGYSLSLMAGYSLQRMENRTMRSSPYYGNQIAYTPEHQASLALALSNPVVNVSLHGFANSHRFTTTEHYDGTRLPSYAELGATVYRIWRIGKTGMETRFELKNILNRQYEIVANYPMPGRSWQFSIKYNL